VIKHIDYTAVEVRAKIRHGLICWGGNKNLKIYGRLGCKAGKRLKIQNRVFFTSQNQAINEGYRPCGFCMKLEYNNWKNGLI
jgi:methylphosphotriester-DNA--protein-cysteine methyltransferase